MSSLREPAPGDVGWVVERHGALYASEFGYDATFEGLVAKIAGAFLESHDASRERCWIAERAGARVGAVFLVKLDEDTAKLRLLIVEPTARGLGVGARAGGVPARPSPATPATSGSRYGRKAISSAARRLYVNEGYRLVAEEPHRSFGLELVAETWQLDLAAA